MAPVYTNQYRPVARAGAGSGGLAERTDTDCGVDVAAIRDVADAINNAKAHVMGPVWSSCWPRTSSTGATGVRSAGSGTDEEVALRMAPIWVPVGLNKWHWSCGAVMDAGTAGTMTVRLYVANQPYKPGGAVTAASLAQLNSYQVDSLVFTSTTHAVKSSLLLKMPFANSGMAWPFLTLQNSISADRGSITALTFSAKLV